MMRAVNVATGRDLKVFYDGQCIVCSKEIDVYRRKDKNKKIEFVDISSLAFDPASEGLDPAKVKSVFHVKDSQNNLHTGVDGFVAIWDFLGIFKPLSTLAKARLGRPVLDLGYFAFTKVRPFLPRKKCNDGSCNF
jgi:predicted DCC family thiol-disulfide oxidoreductase YuxK